MSVLIVWLKNPNKEHQEFFATPSVIQLHSMIEQHKLYFSVILNCSQNFFIPYSFNKAHKIDDQLLQCGGQCLTLPDEQQRFKYDRFCIHDVFVTRWITEKSIDSDDFEKTFNSVKLKEVIHLLNNRQIQRNILKTIENNRFGKRNSFSR